jgi:IPT/TIG domain
VTADARSGTELGDVNPPNTGEPADRINLNFVDLLYAVPVTALATRVGAADLEHVSAAAWGDSLLALIALTFGWVGHHTNRRRREEKAPEPAKASDKTFTELRFWQFGVEVGIIGVYFALTASLSLPYTRNAQLDWKAWWIFLLFLLYLFWDGLDVWIARVRAKRPPNGQAPDEYKTWKKRAVQGGIVTALFLAVFGAVLYSVPAGRWWTVPFDLTCIALLYVYRVSQQEWIAAFLRGDRYVRCWRRRLVVAVAILVVVLGLAGLLTKLFSWRVEAVAVARLKPNYGVTTGGTPVTVRGKNFDPGETVFRVGKNAATNVLCLSPTECTLLTPPGRGTTHVVAALPGGESSSPSAQSVFTYTKSKSIQHIFVELTAYGRRLLRTRLGKRCLNDDLHGLLVAGPSSTPTVLGFASRGCSRVRMRVTPNIGAVYLSARGR